MTMVPEAKRSGRENGRDLMLALMRYCPRGCCAKTRPCGQCLTYIIAATASDP